MPLLLYEVKQCKSPTFVKDDDASSNSQRVHLYFEVVKVRHLFASFQLGSNCTLHVALHRVDEVTNEEVHHYHYN